ncbi:hypothetical protein B0H19DRAFT_1349205 [Mycena capillaripes]|nr:hypothetical protein B0H19DRAFT_1349205 [Mycena capillaripes]
MPSFSMTFALGLITSFLATATATNPSAPIAAATCYVDSCDKPSLPFLASKTTSQTVRAALRNVVLPVSNLLGCHGATNASAEMSSAAPPPQTSPAQAWLFSKPNATCLARATVTSSICGGGFRLSVYTLPTSTIKKRTARSNVSPGPTNVSAEMNSLAPLLTTPGSGLALPQTECNMPCAGDGGTICGGGFRLSLYTVPAHARRNYRPNFRHSLQKRTCPSSTGTLIGKPTASAAWRR